jgi:hypothetical protein
VKSNAIVSSDEEVCIQSQSVCYEIHLDYCETQQTAQDVTGDVEMKASDAAAHPYSNQQLSVCKGKGKAIALSADDICFVNHNVSPFTYKI